MDDEQNYIIELNELKQARAQINQEKSKLYKQLHNILPNGDQYIQELLPNDKKKYKQIMAQIKQKDNAINRLEIGAFGITDLQNKLIQIERKKKKQYREYQQQQKLNKIQTQIPTQQQFTEQQLQKKLKQREQMKQIDFPKDVDTLANFLSKIFQNYDQEDYFYLYHGTNKEHKQNIQKGIDTKVGTTSLAGYLGFFLSTDPKVAIKYSLMRRKSPTDKGIVVEYIIDKKDADKLKYGIHFYAGAKGKFLVILNQEAANKLKLNNIYITHV